MSACRIDLLEEDAARSLTGVPVERLADKTVLVTGASGLIGTQMLMGLAYCQMELGIPIDVVAVVRSSVPEHLRPYAESGLATFLTGDLNERELMDSLPRAHVIVHAATYGQPMKFLDEAVATLKLNTAVTCALLDKVIPGGHFLFCSSSEVYSGLNDSPYGEDQIGTTTPAHLRSSYIEGKRCGEAMCHAYRTHGVDAKVARLSLAYGPGTRTGDARVLNSFIEQALSKGEIRLRDRGEANRTYCYVADAVHMLWMILLDGKQATPPNKGGYPVYNVGGISGTTIVELANLIGRWLGVPVIVPPDDRDRVAGAVGNGQMSISRYADEFGPVEFMGLPEGLARTIAWQRGIYER